MKEIAAALLKVQQDLDPIKKGKKGHNNKYADLPAVLDEAVETLNKHGIIVLQPIQPANATNHARVETLLVHAASGESISGSAEVPWRSDNKMNDAQSYGSAVTYARRYSLVSMLAISTEDDDGQSAHSRPQAKPPASARSEGPTGAEKAARTRAEEKMSAIRTALSPLDSYQQAEWLRNNPSEVEAIKWLKAKMPDLYAEISGLGVEV